VPSRDAGSARDAPEGDVDDVVAERRCDERLDRHVCRRRLGKQGDDRRPIPAPAARP
jgi:hypothetical protein